VIGFGLDLAGYITGKTTLAVVEIEGRNVKATLLRESALSVKRNSGDALKEVLREEAATLRRCLNIGPLAADIPIDLQDLRTPIDADYIWQLTRRPVDRAIGAMPPLADRIGAPVARFAAIMCEGDFDALLGEKLFEAYPAGTLKMLKIKAGHYKGEAGAHALIRLCKTLRIKPRVESDDDIDAIICAITAAAPVSAVHDADAMGLCGVMPRGFRIPKSLSFEQVVTSVAPFESWMAKREAAA
jgi:hypothetical protein